jgi:hypothetical protein
MHVSSKSLLLNATTNNILVELVINNRGLIYTLWSTNFINGYNNTEEVTLLYLNNILEDCAI